MTEMKLSDKPKKSSGRKRKLMKQETESKNNDSYITSENGNIDEAVSSKERKEGKTEKPTSEDQVQLSENCFSTLPSESCRRLSISREDPVAKDPIFLSREDSLPDADMNGASRKGSRRREKKKKKKEDASMLDDAERNTIEDQVHPPKNWSNSIIQEGSRKHTQDSCENPGVAQLCTGPNLSKPEDSRPDATNMTYSQKRKRKKESDRNTLRESGADIHSANAEVAEKYNIITEAEGSKLMSIEEKNGANVVIRSCLKSKDDTVEQREGTDAKLNEIVSQTQSPKAKKKKRRTKTMEVCDPLGKTLATSMQSGPVECMENNDGNAVRELTSNLASKRETSATAEENGFQNLRRPKEKKTDENIEVKEDVLGADEFDVRGKKRKGKRNKIVSADHKAADMEVCDPSGNSLLATVESGLVECLLDHSNRKDVQNCYKKSGKEFVDEGRTSKTEKSAMKEKRGVHNPGKGKTKTEDENVESNQDALGGECVSDAGRKRQKRKIKEDKNSESVADMDSESVQCLLYHSNREGVETCKWTADRGIASKDMASKIEYSTTGRKNVENVENTKKRKKDQKGEVDPDGLGAESVCKVVVKTTEDSATEGKSFQNVKNTKKKKKEKKVDHDALEAEAVSKVERKSVQNDENTKKRKKYLKGDVVQDALGVGINKAEVEAKKRKKKKSKKKRSSLDHKIDNMKENDDGSLHRNDEELEVNRETLEASLSRTVLIHNNVTQGVLPPETGDVPRCSCEGQSTKKLVVFDLNGILADIVQGFTGQFVPDGKVSYRSVFLRPFVHSFLDFCFERFDIGIWSSRRIGLDYMTNLVMRNHARNLLFCFGQDMCITTKFKTLENSTKPLFLKDLRRVWECFGTCFTCGNRKYDETNTLLVDDSPDKSLCNPPHTGIFPHTYQYTDREDSALGPEGELRKYLERLADATSLQKFVAENPFGQTAITETHESWKFYSKVVEAYRKPSRRVLTM